MRLRLAVVAVTLSCTTVALAESPEPAQAFNPLNTACSVAGWFSGLVGKACKAGNKLLGVGKKLLGGSSGSGSKLQAAIGLAAIGAWVMGGAKVAMEETAKVLSHTTTPRLTTTWFSSTYWRVAGIAAILTLPFLFAAAVQALTRSDLSLLMRASFGYLPLSLLAVGIAAPLIMLLLSATDQMCSIVSAAAGNAGPRFLSRVGAFAGAVSILDGSAFLAFLIGLFVALGALVVWLELLIREAAVYVIVLMLPLAFAALVWPARRVWAIRAVELLVALILSKFAIVAVLTLGGAALGQSPFSGTTSMMVGLVLVILGALAPWAMLRLIPLAEMASGAVSALHGEAGRVQQAGSLADRVTHAAMDAGRRNASSGDDFDADPEPVHQQAARAETERLSGLTPMPVPAGHASANGRDKEPSDPEEAGAEAPETTTTDDRGAEANTAGDIFSAEDWSWPTIHLGMNEGWPPPSPTQAEAPSQAEKPPPPSQTGGPAVPLGDPASPEPPPSQADPVADDHDPLPPEQEPEDGRL